MRKALVLIAIVLGLFALAQTNSDALTQEPGMCGSFSISPNTISQGESFSINKSGGISGSEVVIVSLSPSSGAGQVVASCIDDNPVCGTGESTVLIFENTVSLLTDTSYAVNIRFIDGSNNVSSCSEPLTVLSTDDPSPQEYCDNQGISSVSPTAGDENTVFAFEGCVGPGLAIDGDLINPCNGKSRIVLCDISNFDVSCDGPQLSITDSGLNTCNVDGTFSLSTSQLTEGVYAAQLYVGRSSIGNQFTIDVEANEQTVPGEACEEIKTCVADDGSAGTQFCTGAFEGAIGNLTCTASSCGACGYCGDRVCNSDLGEIGSCAADCAVVSVPEDFYCDDKRGIRTAIGCVSIESVAKISAAVLFFAISIAGGIAFLLIIFAGFKISTSSGDPKRLQGGKELMTSAIAGVILIVFSVVILRILGANILEIF